MSKTCLVCLECDDRVVTKENIYNCQCKFDIHPACFEEYKKKFNSCMYCRQNLTRESPPLPGFTDLNFEWYDESEIHPLLSFRRLDDDLLDQWHFFNNFHERMIRPIRIYNRIQPQPQLISHLRLYRRPPSARFQYLEYRFSF